MKKQVKGTIGLVAAMALVLIVGMTLSDHSLKATDGEENYVATEDSQVTEGQELEEEDSAEIIVEDETEEISTDDADTQENEEEIEKIEETEDTEEEEDIDYDDPKYQGTVTITSTTDIDSPVEDGEKITLTAEVEGFEGLSYHFQWYRSLDGENWEEVAGATSQKYTFTMNDENDGYQWSVQLIED